MAKVMRAPKLDLAAMLQEQNPQIDLRLEAYEASTRNFLKAVSSYTQRALAEITLRKNTHITQRKKLTEKIHHIETETNQCKVREIELVKGLDQENEERRNEESSVAVLRRQLASLKERCAVVDVEMEQHRMTAANLHREKESEEQLLENHATHLSPELGDSAHRLQCTIEGIDKDKVLICFKHQDSARNSSLVLDVSSKTYRVPTMTPFLPSLPILLEELNESRDLYSFVKQVRSAFLQLTL